MSIKRRYLIVENNHSSLSDVIEQLSGLVGPADFKVALNGGHAYLHIDHLHLSGKFKELELVLLLNIHTPLSNGFEFLNAYKGNRDFPKENIRILVRKDNLTAHEIKQAEAFGVEFFTLKNLSASIDTNSSSPPEAAGDRKTENFVPVSEPVPNQNKNFRGFTSGHARA